MDGRIQMKKDILINEEARDKIKEGVNKLADVVTSTLGPRGRNVAIMKPWGVPIVIHDGVSVAKEVVLKDDFENIGAQIVKQASEKTNDIAGDGTTTAVLLAREIVNEGFGVIGGDTVDLSKKKINPMKLRYELEEAMEKVIEELRKQSKPISTIEEKFQVANVSAQNEKLGKVISEAIELVGDKGVISVDESKGMETEMEYAEGIFIDSGYVSPYFINNQRKASCEVKNAYILVTDNPLETFEGLIPLIEVVVKKSKSFIVVCDSTDQRTITSFLINKANGSLEPLVVKAPGFGDYRVELLKDLAIVLGAKFIGRDVEKNLRNVRFEDLGYADKVVALQDRTTFVGGAGKKEAIEDRIKELEEIIKQKDNEFDVKKIKERIAKLSGGVAIIKVGASTEAEVEELKLRVEDAVNATKAAVEEGIVPGGGLALKNARECLVGLKTTGSEVLYKVLGKPVEKILKNSGIDDIDLEDIKGNTGVNVMTRKLENLVEVGIIDPTKVVISALKNAVSAAVMVLTTDALIVDISEEDKDVNGS
jgi:chaperonin GroEL